MKKIAIFILSLIMMLSVMAIPVYAAELTTQPTSVDPPDASKRSAETLVGAIRFDGWSGKSIDKEWGVADKLKVALSDAAYADRIPFFAKLEGTNVDFSRYKQEYMDQEIEYAYKAGIDYFAYNYYKNGTGLDIPMKYHLASTIKSNVKIATIVQESSFDYKNDVADLYDRIIKSEAYLTTLNDRAVIYVKYGSNPEYVVNAINYLRKKAKANKLETPFIIVMDAPTEADAIAVGADAVSWYNVTAKGGQSFADLAASAEAKWNAAKSNTKLSAVPIVTTGYDKRPVAAKPINIVDATTGASLFADTATADDYAAAAKPAEIGKHLQNAVDFNKANVDKTVFNSVLMFAWNEFADGGWLCPTRDAAGTKNTERLDALKGAANAPTPAPTVSPTPTEEPTDTPEPTEGPGINIVPIGIGAGVVLVAGIVVAVAVAAGKKKKTSGDGK